MKQVYQAHPRRWWVLATVSLLNASINSNWMCLAPVATKTANYFEVSTSSVDLLLAAGYLPGIFIGIAATWLVEYFGLRKIILFSTTCAFVGVLLRAVTTFPGIGVHIDPSVQYWSTFVGTLILGIANPLAFCLPTKVSHDWFPESEGFLASGIISMSFIMGIALASGITPFICRDAEDLPFVFMTFSIPMLITFIISLIFIRSDRPPMAPSRSADMLTTLQGDGFLDKMRKLFSNPNFLVLVFSIGGIVGLFNGVFSQLQQILCSRGYPDWFSGLCGLILLVSGVAGGVLSSLVVQRTGWLEEIAKFNLGFGVFLACIQLQLFLVAHQRIVILILSFFIGFFAFGILPLGFELSLEVIYPTDPASGVSVIFVFGQLVATVLIAISGVVERQLSDGYLSIETCTSSNTGLNEQTVEAKDHTIFILILTFLASLLSISLTVLFRGKLKRRMANQGVTDETIDIQK